MKKGTFYGVGVGPGDPELLTLKAIRAMEHCPVIAAPETRGEKTLALDIARGAVDLSQKTILTLEFLMTRDKQKLEESHRAQARAVMEYLDQGQDVAMLNLGDVSIYSTFSYLLEIIKEAGYETEVIPGVPSFCAVAAALGRSLTEPEAPLHVYPAGKTDLDAALAQPGTKVLMKSGSTMAATAQALERQGLAGKSAMVADCGLPTEQVFQTMENLPEKISYFATVIVPEK